VAEDTKVDSFTEFVEASERRLRLALTAVFGFDVGREAAADSLVYGWEHWDRVIAMENPSGYLYRVGYNRGRDMLKRRRVVLPEIPEGRLPWVEPGLDRAVAELPEKQRSVVLLLYGFEWSMTEVADMLGISKASVQTHAGRGMAKLRRKLGVST
jgi:DNA-directed RNA polymerase specialized sigma24 family protein